jgi:hypothetical protein
MSVQYDYDTFIFAITCGTWYKISGTPAYTESSVRLQEWQSHQKDILPALQMRIDQGWEPIAEVGPASIKLKSYKKQLNPTLAVLGVILAPFTIGMTLMWLIKDTVAEPTEFSLPMRRRR